MNSKLCLYFHCALENVSEGNVMEDFTQSLNDITPKVNGLELLKYTCHNWRSDFCTEQSRTLVETREHARTRSFCCVIPTGVTVIWVTPCFVYPRSHVST